MLSAQAEGVSPVKTTTSLTIGRIREIADRRSRVTVDHDRRDAVARLHARLEAVGGLPVYGRTTGVGANRTIAVDADDADHGMRLLRSHAVEFGPTLPAEQTRAMLAVRLCQLSHVGSGIRPDVLDGLAMMLDLDALPTLHRHAGSVGTADLSALARTALTLVGELPASRPFTPIPPLGADSALPFLSSSALTIGRAALALERLRRLDGAAVRIFALTAAAVGANSQHWSETAAAATVSPGCHAVASEIRALFSADGADPVAARVQDPYGIRAFAVMHGALRDAAERAVSTTEALTGVAQENPLFTLDGDVVRVTHHAGFFQIRLALDIDGVDNALAALVPLSISRLRMLSEPSITGLKPFLASGPTGSSGTMIVEYVAAAAGAEMRASSAPVASGSTVLSRGTEEDATFAPQAVTQLERSLSAWRVVLASELLTAVRALRQRDLSRLVPDEVARAFEDAGGGISGDDDRDLGPVLDAADRALTALADAVPR